MPAEKNPTLLDVSRLAGVSIGTVSKILNRTSAAEKFSGKTHAGVLRAAAQLRYRPNSAARSMKTKSSRQVGVLVHDTGGNRVSEVHSFEFIMGINHVLEEKHFVLSLIEMSDLEKGEHSMMRVFQEHLLDGMIVRASLIESARRNVSRFMDTCIWCDVGSREAEDCLWRDEREAGRLAGSAVLAAGYRCVAWVSNDTEPDRRYIHGTERLEGLNAALSAESLAPKSFNIPYFGNPSATDLSECYVPGTAIVASEYRTATAIAHHAATFGKCPGRDFGLVCCDDSASFIQQWPHLSRASFDRNALGKKAAEIILRRLEKPHEPTLSVIDKPEWIEGTTIGRAHR